MSSVDDPEKHFLGNLLEDDPGSPAVSSSVTPSFSRSNDTILPQLANVGPVMRPVSDPLESSAWPEPPPPYSPRLDWGLSNANTTLTSSTTPGNSWYPFMDRKETSSSELLGSFNLGGCSSTAAVPPPTLSCAPLPPSPQIHHFHHNLHHHTHTHNVQVQNHYFGSPPPGLEAYGPRPTPSTPPTPPRNIVSNNVPLYESVTPNWSYTGIANINANSNSKLFSDWKKENMSSQTSPEPTIISNSTTSLGSSELEEPEKVLVHLPLTSSEVVERAKEKKNVSKSYADHLSKSKKETAIGAEKKHKQELAKKMSSQTLGENKANHVQVKEQPHSAPVVSKMPFSYRDVAARVEHSHNSGHAIHHHEEMASHHHEKKDKARTGDKSSDTKAVHTKTNDIHHDSSKEANEKKSEGSRKSRSDNEFQKINSRKNKKEKNSTVVAAPLIYESVHPVDASSRYDVLKNLESVPVQRNGKKAANGRPPLIQEVFSRSSSPAISDMCDTEEEDPQRTRSASNHIHQNGSNQMKKEQKKRVLQANQRRQKEQKKESNWIDKGFEDIKMFLQMLLQLVYEGFKWTIELVVDFCSKIYDVMHHSLEGLYAGAGKGIRRFFMFLINLLFYTVFLFRTCIYVISTFIIINLLGIVDDDEDRQEMNWGCKREIPIPTNATEYADRLSRETIRDAYSVFGLKSDCSNDEIKRNYKRLAALVSPEKCSIEAVDEVFFLVNVAFEAIGTQDARKDYTAENSRDSQIHEKVLSAWKEMSIRVEEARNTIYCDCTKRHFRIATVIPPSQARSCKRCEIKHPAKQNDIWVEKRHFGLSTVYLTCTDNVVYDITEWATCESQHAMLKNMRAHTHHVQYRLLSPMSNDYDAPSPSSSSQYFNSSMNYPSTSSTDARFLSDLQEEYSSLLRQRSLAQISFKTCEPREEDRSRRAANRRQKRWR